MRRGRRDGNHADVVGWFEALGCSVAEATDTGIPGLPDLLVGCCGVTHLVEVKDTATAYGRAGLSKTQTAFARDWRGGPIHTATTLDEVAALVQTWRRGTR